MCAPSKTIGRKETMTDHRKAIEERIAYHREEIRKLETALEVIAGLETEAKPKAARKVETRAKQKAGKKSAAATQRGGLSPAEMRENVMKALKEEGGPMTSAEIAAAIGMDGSRQPVYQALHTLKSSGKVARDGDGRYTASAV